MLRPLSYLAPLSSMFIFISSLELKEFTYTLASSSLSWWTEYFNLSLKTPYYCLQDYLTPFYKAFYQKQNSNIWRSTHYYCFYSSRTGVLLLFVRIYHSPGPNSSKHSYTIVLRWMMSKLLSVAQIFLLNASLYFQLFIWHVPEPFCLAWLPREEEPEMEISMWMVFWGLLLGTPPVKEWCQQGWARRG